ncbi:MAG: Veg family protein [Clostridiales bacterium]|nr:Veg family protein [Clostridiales bacterium]MDR2751568.1 Veg family protein [Clostridiales bacterium]
MCATFINTSEVAYVFDKNDVFHVKKDIERRIGSRVILETNKGRHKSVINEGVIANVYPSIFTIQLMENDGPNRKMSFSYTDVLTNSVEITLAE